MKINQHYYESLFNASKQKSIAEIFIYGGVMQVGHRDLLRKQKETVYLLCKLNVEHHIELEVNLDEIDLMAAENKASCEKIKAYVKEWTDLQISNLYIAQVKRKCGLIERVIIGCSVEICYCISDIICIENLKIHKGA